MLGGGGATGSEGEHTGYDGSPAALELQTKAKSSRYFDIRGMIGTRAMSPRKAAD